MRTGKVILYITWILAVALLVLITLYNQTKVNSFMGLTQSKQRIINFPFPVQVKEVFVTVGEKVNKGQKVAEVVRVDVNDKTFSLNSKIQELESKKALKIKELSSKLEFLNRKKEKELAEIDYKILGLKEKRKANRTMMQSLSISPVAKSSLDIQIDALKKKKESIKNIYETQKENILVMLDHTQKMFDAELKLLSEKKSILFEENTPITIFAPYDASIGSIACTSGEALKPYDEIMTIHPVYPQYVTGYIHEDVQIDIKIGDSVIISPMVNLSGLTSDNNIKGIVKSISTRIVSFPVRLKKFKVVPLWGYKVLIEIPENNLMLGQKVSVQKENNIKNFKLFDLLDQLKLH